MKTSVNGKHGILADEGQTMVDRDIVRLLHIRDAIEAIEEYAAVGRERFLTEALTQDAMIWQLGIPSEATTRLSADLRRRYPGLESGRTDEIRNEFEHNFLNFDCQLAWDMARNTLPALKQTVEAILAEERRQNRTKHEQVTELSWEPELTYDNGCIAHRQSP